MRWKNNCGILDDKLSNFCDILDDMKRKEIPSDGELFAGYAAEVAVRCLFKTVSRSVLT